MLQAMSGAPVALQLSALMRVTDDAFVKALEVSQSTAPVKRGACSLQEGRACTDHSTERSELLSIAPLQIAPIKSSVDVSPFSEAPLAYRWLQIEPKELRMALGDFEPFYCHFALYDISKRVRFVAPHMPYSLRMTGATERGVLLGGAAARCRREAAPAARGVYALIPFARCLPHR